MQDIMDNAAAIRTAGIMVMGGLTLLGVYWQRRVWRNDARKFEQRQIPTRISFSLAICALLLTGVTVRGLIAIYLDPRRQSTLESLLAELVVASGFCLIFMIQAYVGPLMTCAALVMSAYFFFEHHELYIVPIVQSSIDLLASLGPEWTNNTYIIIVGTYTVVTSFKDAVA